MKTKLILFTFLPLLPSLLGEGFGVTCFSQSNRLWATYYGGIGDEYGYSVATDAVGNVYIAGKTNSTSGIASGGLQNSYGGGTYDIFLVKFNAAGNRLWATYYGGTGEEGGFFNNCSIAIDAAGNVYLAGTTQSTTGIASGGFQNTFGGNVDAFLVKLDGAGNRLWATYYGGTGSDKGFSVATDISGNVYLAGHANGSSSAIASGGFQNIYGGGWDGDAFLVKFDASGTRLWATYYGGSDNDVGYSVATDALGNVYLAGSTQSTQGIASGGFQNTLAIVGGLDAFLVKFDAAGNRLWATYYGGNGTEQGYSITNDALSNVYLTGYTTSLSNITSGGFQNTYGGGPEDAFLVKFSSSGTRLWATYYGGWQDDYGYSLTTNTSGSIFLAGYTQSSTLIASGGFQNTFGGAADAFLVQFDAAGNRLCATYYGGTGFDGYGFVTTDASGNLYMAGHTDGSSSAIASGGFQNTFGGINDAFLVKFTSCCPSLLAVSISATNIVCHGGNNGSATVTTSGGAPSSYNWSPSGGTNAIASNLSAGTYSVTITDSNGCTQMQTVIIAQPAAITISPSITQSSCSENTGTTTANVTGGTGNYTYSWSNSQTTQTAITLGIGIYTITVTDNNGCTQTAQADVTPYVRDLHLPNAFSPNQDRENDEFCLQQGMENCIKDLSIIIYDRWGEKVFESDDPAFCWDGTFNVTPMNTAVFFYYLEATLTNQQVVQKKGNISLIR